MIIVIKNIYEHSCNDYQNAKLSVALNSSTCHSGVISQYNLPVGHWIVSKSGLREETLGWQLSWWCDARLTSLRVSEVIRLMRLPIFISMFHWAAVPVNKSGKRLWRLAIINAQTDWLCFGFARFNTSFWLNRAAFKFRFGLKTQRENTGLLFQAFSDAHYFILCVSLKVNTAERLNSYISCIWRFCWIHDAATAVACCAGERQGLKSPADCFNTTNAEFILSIEPIRWGSSRHSITLI